MLTPLHSMIGRGEHESISSCHYYYIYKYGNTEYSLMTARTPMEKSGSGEIRPIALAFIELRLSEGISQIQCSQSVEKC